MSITQDRNVGEVIDIARAAANTAVTAGGAGDNQAVTGVVVDLAALGQPQSCAIAIPFTATLGQGETLSIAHTLQHGTAANLSDAATYQSRAATVVATGPTGGGTVSGVVKVNVPLRGARRYVRLNFTPDLSRANTDTAALSAVMVFGGAERLPR